jgi:hypothetical protein
MPADDTRAEQAQATGLRHHQERKTNYLDQDFRVVASEDYEEADMVAEGAAVWGDPIRVSGYDRLTAFLAHTQGTATTAVHVAAQVLYEDNATTARWFDLYEDEADDGILVRKVWDLVTAVSTRVGWSIPTVGRYMRFKVWADGGNRANSRALLEVTRQMDSM